MTEPAADPTPYQPTGDPPQPRRHVPGAPRVTVVEQVVHQEGGRTTPIPASRFARELDSDEQCYSRKLRVRTGPPTPLDFAWVRSPGMLLFRNESRVECVTLWAVPQGDQSPRPVPFAYVRPSESCRFEPYPGAAYLASVAEGEWAGEAVCKLVLIPS